jgi:hypothetical protein
VGPCSYSFTKIKANGKINACFSVHYQRRRYNSIIIETNIENFNMDTLDIARNEIITIVEKAGRIALANRLKTEVFDYYILEQLESFTSIEIANDLLDTYPL